MTGPVPDPGWRNKSFGELAMGRASEGEVPLRIGPTCPFARPVDRAATELAVLMRPVESEVTPVDSEVIELFAATIPVDSNAIELLVKLRPVDSEVTPLVPTLVIAVDSEAIELFDALKPVDSEPTWLVEVEATENS